MGLQTELFRRQLAMNVLFKKYFAEYFLVWRQQKKIQDAKDILFVDSLKYIGGNNTRMTIC